MAEPDSLMQLGIEAARDGNKEEARNLFRLLTLQDPANAQAWLWLAGVAESREERQAALERVVELDPTNEMAVKGLQALGVQPGGHPVGHHATPEPVVPVAMPDLPLPAPVMNDDPFGDDDDPFAELNNLSSVIADSEAPARRNDPLPAPIAFGDEPPSSTGASTGSRSSSTGSRSSSTGSRSSSTGSRSSSTGSRSSSTGSRSSRSSIYDDDNDTVPAQRGMSPLRSIILALIGILLISLIVIVIFFRDSGTPVAQQTQPTLAAATSQAATAAAGSLEPTAILAGGTGTENGTTQPITGTTTAEAPTIQPTAAPAATAVIDVSQANPVIVPANTPLQSDGWLYDFNQPTYAAPIIGPLGQYQPNNGRFAVVLVFVVNNTGTSQTIPAEFFVLKDAQGRVWTARPEVSDAYVSPGINADLSHSQALPPDGLTRSVALIFDVAPDATNLVFFARSNLTQGWLVLPNV